MTGGIVAVIRALRAGGRHAVPALLGVSAFAYLALAGACLCCLQVCGCSKGDAAEQTARPDLIEISIVCPPRGAEREPVLFPHDPHVEATTKEGKDCTVCHLKQENGLLSPKYKRLENPGPDELMELYHNNCITCHTKKADAGEKAGPVTCGGCHRRRPLFVSSRQPFGFDKSLHYRHVSANNEKCELCHHVYDEEAKKLVYEKGKEGSCRDCHREQTEDNRVSFEIAAHWACIGCHMKIAQERPEAKVGPRVCAGCHDLERQRAIEVVQNPPRMKRNQPDFVLLSAPEAQLESSKLATVPFSHVDHEESSSTCRICHHETMDKCNECHTLGGSDKGKGVTLQQAMHDMTSDHSCAGCHELKKSGTECAGCHDLMQQRELSEHACGICHAGPAPQVLERVRSRYTSMKQFEPELSEIKPKFTSGDIPDSVVIGVLTKEYEPAVMPHGKIVKTLNENIKKSKLASHFHGEESVMCQGCHHHGSVGVKPALCENCHSKPFDEHYLYKPGLYGAYHRQCLGCHDSMNMKKPKDCAGCHAKKEDMTERTTSSPIH